MTNAPEELGGLRADIDRIDEVIGELVADRVALAEEIAAVKSAADADLVDEDREDAVKSHYEERFREEGLEPASGRALAEFLIEVSLEHEKALEGNH